MGLADFVLLVIDNVINTLPAGRRVSPIVWLVSGLLLVMFVIAAVLIVIFYLY